MAGTYGWQPYHHPVPLSWNLRTLTSWNLLGHSRPVTGLLYLFFLGNPDILPSSPYSTVLSGVIPISPLADPNIFIYICSSHKVFWFLVTSTDLKNISNERNLNLPWRMNRVVSLSLSSGVPLCCSTRLRVQSRWLEDSLRVLQSYSVSRKVI